MSEMIIDELDSAIFSVLEGIDDPVAIMATIASMVYHFDTRFDWVGFYRNRGDDSLIIGPYQGTLGCLEIPFSKGVCGYVARNREAIIVPDVEKFDGHIACSSSTRSELVLPIINRFGELLAVFDLDSNQENAFREADKIQLEAILTQIFSEISLERFLNAH